MTRVAEAAAGVTVVIATRNRRRRLLATLERLRELDERPPVVVVDNASTDGTANAVHAWADVVRLPRDIGPAARTVGVERARTPLVAFCDDDSWWAPDALTRAAAVFAAYPRLGLLAARIVVEPRGDLDPTCEAMRDSPIEAPFPLPGPAVLGFVACAAVARRSAILECGGFDGRYGFGGEEQLLAADLMAAGWGLAYVDDVVAHHQPAKGPRAWRDTRTLRNQLWFAWLRRPLPQALRTTLALATAGDGNARSALTAALRGLPWVLRERRPVPPHVERRLRRLEDAG